MEAFSNLDLLSLAVTVGSAGILGFTVYFSNRKSITSVTFLLFAIVTILWSTSNYFYYHGTSPQLGLWLIRSIVFLGVWHALLFFQLCYVFPEAHITFPKSYRKFLLPLVALTSLVTLTPLVFAKVISISESGVVLAIQNGPALPLFGITIVALIVLGLGTLARKIYKANGVAKKQLLLVAAGTFITFVCITYFNFILPALFENPRYIPLSSVFIIPFVLFTSLAIFHFKLFQVKVFATSSLVFVLCIAMFAEIIFSTELSQLIFRSSLFILLIGIGVLLIRSVVREVEQREHIEKLAKELETANSRLKELDRQKTEFVSIASHQLRSPLTAIKGYASLLLEGSFGKVPKGGMEAIQKIFTSSQYMATSIEDFLNVSRIELGTIKYDLKEFDLSKMVEEVVSELLPAATDKKLSLKFEGKCDGPCMIKGDIGKLRQVVLNLVDNAMKYTPKGGITVIASTNRKENAARIEVIDTGVGIPDKVMPTLFAKFIRAANANEVNVMGTGLGLYVAKQFVEAHGGRVWAESKGQNKGSTFIVEFPLLNGANTKTPIAVAQK